MMNKGIVGEKWCLCDTGVVRLPRGEKFISFMKIKRIPYVISNKAIYKLVKIK
jgi:hypothetical protein